MIHDHNAGNVTLNLIGTTACCAKNCRKSFCITPDIVKNFEILQLKPGWLDNIPPSNFVTEVLLTMTKLLFYQVLQLKW